MKRSRKLLPFLISGLLTFGLISCSDDGPSNARLQVALVDAPAEYDSVFVDVEGVTVKFGAAEESDEGGWQDISTFEPQRFNLLDLTNGTEMLLADAQVPAGTLGEVRLLLGSDNSLYIGEDEKALTVPSGSSSGLKIKLNTELKAGVTYKLILDFDAAKSIVDTGSGAYNLKPVIHANMEAQTGAISGSVVGLESGVVIYAIQNEDSVSTYPDDTGAFLIRALEAGTYDVVAVPEADIAAMTVEDIAVEIGVVSSAGTISFE